jgi:outer membrane protein TolC
MGGTPNVREYMDNPSNFRVFRAFMVDEALAASPELREIDAAIDAQDRLLSSRKNAYWAPTLALFGDLDYRLAAGGLGSTPGAGLPPGSVPVNDDLDWAVGIGFSLPLLVGGARPADVGRVSAELEALRLQRADLAQRIEQRVRSELHEAGASYANIQLAADAATAAQRSFDLVTDSYSRGVANLVDLIDAQNTSLVADFGAANAVYSFLIDFMQVERSVGRFQMFADADVRQDFFDRLDNHFDAAGMRR